MVIFCAPVKLKNRPSFLRSSGSRAMPAAIASAGNGGSRHGRATGSHRRSADRFRIVRGRFHSVPSPAFRRVSSTSPLRRFRLTPFTPLSVEISRTSSSGVLVGLWVLA